MSDIFNPSSGGGVSQIIAGTNITISPSGGTGNVTINSSGGGGAPGTPVNSIQFNNPLGTFAGDANWVYNPTGSAATIKGSYGFFVTNFYEAAHFDGISSISATTTGFITGDSPSSAFAWVRTTTSTLPVIAYGNSINKEQRALLINVTAGNQLYFSGYNNDVFTTATNIADGNWHFIGYSYAGSGNITLYYDGVAHALTLPNGALNTTLAGNPSFIGTYIQGGNFVGDIEEVQYYNIALSSGQVALLYNGGAGFYGVPGALAGHGISGYHLNGDATDFIDGNDGTWTGMELYVVGHISTGVINKTPEIEYNNGLIQLLDNTNISGYLQADGGTVYDGGILAIGAGSTSIGSSSIAIGIGSSATKVNSTAIGSNSSALGAYSAAVGSGARSVGSNSFAVGSAVTAIGDGSSVYGSSSRTGGLNSTGLGYGIYAIGDVSLAMGNNTTSQGYSQTTIGKFNILQGTSVSWDNTDQAFIIGNGADGSHLSNAFAVDWLGALNLTQSPTPLTPPAGYDKVYFKADDNLWQIDSNANEMPVDGYSWETIPSGKSITIATYRQMVVQHAINIIGSLNLFGTLALI